MLKLLRVSAVAERLGVSFITIYRLLEKGDIKGTRVSKRSIRISEDEIDNFLARQNKKPEQANEHH